MISVIIPTYNRAACLERSIGSILAQTYNDWELIIVDDGSTDNTKKLVTNMASSKVRYIYQEHRGACYARNRGIREANGEYIAFQDSDDYWHPSKLEMQMNCMCQENADIVFCAFERKDIDNKYIGRVPCDQNQRSGFIDIFDILPENICSTQTLLLKKECFNYDLFNEDLPRLQDWDLMIRLVQKYKVYFLNEILVTQYFQKDSISYNTEAYLTSINYVFACVIDILKDKSLIYKINEKDKQIVELKDKLNYLSAKLDVKDKLLLAFKDRCRQLELELDSYHISTIGKLTALYRYVIDKIRSSSKNTK